MGLEGPRTAQPSELQGVIALCDAVFTQSSGRPHHMGPCFPVMFSEGNLGRLLVFVSEGRKPVSHVGLEYSTLNLCGHPLPVAGMGAVCTAPEFRQQGLASQLLELAQKSMSADNIGLVWISGGRGLYHRFGAVRAGVVHQFTITGPCMAHKPGFLSIAEVDAGSDSALHVLAKLYQLEPVHYRRSLDEFRIRWHAAGSARVRGLRLRTFLVSDGGAAVAYIMVGAPRDGSATPGPKRPSAVVMEYAGSRTHIGIAMGCLLETLGLERVALPVMGWDTALLSLGRRAGWAEKQEALPGTFKIINSNALVESLRPWLAESGGEAVAQSLAWDEAGGRFTLEGPGGELSFHPGQFVQLLLGLPAGASEAEGGPNPPEVWAALPLPWIWPCGLNYT